MGFMSAGKSTLKTKPVKRLGHLPAEQVIFPLAQEANQPQLPSHLVDYFKLLRQAGLKEGDRTMADTLTTLQRTLGGGVEAGQVENVRRKVKNVRDSTFAQTMTEATPAARQTLINIMEGIRVNEPPIRSESAKAGGSSGLAEAGTALSALSGPLGSMLTPSGPTSTTLASSNLNQSVSGGVGTIKPIGVPVTPPQVGGIA